MLPMKVLGLTMDGANNKPILVLRQEDGEAVMPIWIGMSEALAISSALGTHKTTQPLVHDLLLEVVTAMGGELVGFFITDLQKGIFSATLDLLINKRIKQIPCRPSDGVAVALRADIPIFMAKTVLDAVQSQRAGAHALPSDAVQLSLAFPLPPSVLSATMQDANAVPSNETKEHTASASDVLQAMEPPSKRIM